MRWISRILDPEWGHHYSIIPAPYTGPSWFSWWSWFCCRSSWCCRRCSRACSKFAASARAARLSSANDSRSNVDRTGSSHNLFMTRDSWMVPSLKERSALATAALTRALPMKVVLGQRNHICELRDSFWFWVPPWHIQDSSWWSDILVYTGSICSATSFVRKQLLTWSAWLGGVSPESSAHLNTHQVGSHLLWCRPSPLPPRRDSFISLRRADPMRLWVWLSHSSFSNG